MRCGVVRYTVVRCGALTCGVWCGAVCVPAECWMSHGEVGFDTKAEGDHLHHSEGHTLQCTSHLRVITCHALCDPLMSHWVVVHV